jgi:hypothetical protein
MLCLAQRRIFIPVLLGLAACSQTKIAQSPTAATDNRLSSSDYQVVDCLLPGQVRGLGNGSYVTPRRPILTTAADCRIRGGEYVEYDRSDYRTALGVWLPAAEAGDSEAQANVGEIFERGLGGSPNYQAAAIWYQKAAAQGNSRAQFNLGTLYEQGLGVPQDKLIALNWYRKAWGMSEDSLVYQSAAAKVENELRKELQKKVDEKNQQISFLKTQIGNLQAGLQQANKDETEKEISSLRNWIKNLETEQLIAKNDLDKLPQFREPKPANNQTLTSTTKAETINSRGMNFGKYYALIIANQHYDNINDLSTPHADAERAKKILQESYGFEVITLLDADNTGVMDAVNQLNEKVGEEDNLLIFYAGHGTRISTGDLEEGYWLPRNANTPPDDTFWVSNEFVTRHLARLKAKRVMVVADSCYVGLLSSSPGYLFMSAKADYSEDYIRYKLPKRSRLLLTSGGDQPVLDNQGQEHSVFARAFLDALEQGQGIITAPELFLKIKDKVSNEAPTVVVNQMPEFKPIKGAGHEVGDFFFIKQSS